MQQTTVNAVIPYYKKWVKAFPTIKHVANASEQKVLRAWQGLGYYSRAKNIHRCAKLICKEHGGKIPQAESDLRKLPGFGPYTTGAVLSIAYDKKFPIVDANIRRVVMRLKAQTGPADVKHDRKVIDFLEKVMPERNNRTFNQAFMELGALICQSRTPQCVVCPVKSFCKAYKKGLQEIIPEKRKKQYKELDVVVGVLRQGNKYFLQKRPSNGLLGDLWEFPGGKIEKGETPQEALHREIQEELGVSIQRSKHIMNVRHFYTHFKVNLHVSFFRPDRLPPQDRTHKWLTLKGLEDYPLPSGSVKIVDKLRELA